MALALLADRGHGGVVVEVELHAPNVGGAEGVEEDVEHVAGEEPRVPQPSINLISCRA